MEENQFQKEKTIEKILENRGKIFFFKEKNKKKKEKQKKMAKNLAIKKIQGVSEPSKPKQILKKPISSQESEKKPWILCSFFEDSFYLRTQPRIKTKIKIPSALLQEILLNFKLT